MNLYRKIKEKYHYSTFRFVNFYFPHCAFSTLRVFHTPHFPHSAFSTLRVFHTPRFPHSAFSTLRVFHTPHFPHSAFSTLRTPHSALRTLHFPLNRQRKCSRLTSEGESCRSEINRRKSMLVTTSWYETSGKNNSHLLSHNQPAVEKINRNKQHFGTR